MAGDPRDICFATFNLYNLQLPDIPWRQGKRYSVEEYGAKTQWSASLLKAMDADVIAFQELWSPQCLRDLFAEAGLADEYELAFIRDSGWYDIAVAAAVRKPWEIRQSTVHKTFPEGFALRKRDIDSHNASEDEDDDIEVKIDKFSRSVLQLSVGHSERDEVPAIDAFAVHLKSKLATRLDREEREDPRTRPHSAALGSALSTIRRTAEAAALRMILNQVMRETDRPVAVLGDYNDGQLSNTLAIVSEQPSLRLFTDSRRGGRSDRGLYVAGTLQELRSLRDVYYTHIHEGVRETLDHVLVSEQFYDFSRNRVWSFREMRVWNDHVEDEDPATSDHGVVSARFDHNPA